MSTLYSCNDRWDYWVVLVYLKTTGEHPAVWFHALPRKPDSFNASQDMRNYMTKFSWDQISDRILVIDDVSLVFYTMMFLWYSTLRDQLTQDDNNFPDLWNWFMIAHKFIIIYLLESSLKETFLYSSKEIDTREMEDCRLRKMKEILRSFKRE